MEESFPSTCAYLRSSWLWSSNDGIFLTKLHAICRSSADDATTPLLRGSIPQSIAQLDRLQIFSMEHGFVYGNLPQSLFTLPNIREIYLSNTGLTIDFPANISSTITRLFVLSYPCKIARSRFLIVLFPDIERCLRPKLCPKFQMLTGTRWKSFRWTQQALVVLFHPVLWLTLALVALSLNGAPGR